MTTRRNILLFVVATVVCVSACAKSADPEAEQRQIAQVFERYLKSVNTADATLGSTVWLQSAEIVAVTPLGQFQGWDSIQKDLYVNFLQKLFVERDLRASHLQIHVHGESAWAAFDWDFTGKMANGQSMMSKGRESHVYQKTADGWRIVHLHYSGLQPPPS